MATNSSSHAPPEGRWPLILLVSGAGFLAVAAVTVPHQGAPLLLRLVPLLAGTALLVHAIVERLRRAEWDFPSRVETAVYTSVAGGASALIAFGHALSTALGLPGEWDSFRLFYAAAFLLLMSGTVLIILPPLWRKVALSVWLCFHFMGMFTVFASIDPPNGSAPWLANQLWVRVYRPYLQFFYLTNAYHFYSPDPGPPALLWFAVQYDDGTYSWVKVPSRDKSPVGMHYQRLLALPEHSFVATGRVAPTEAERLALARQPKPFHVSPRRVWEEVYGRRENASGPRYRADGTPVSTHLRVPGWRSRLNGLPIPHFADLDLLIQYREPNDASRKCLASVARRVLLDAKPRAWEGDRAKAPENGLAQPTSVKMYRMVHQCLSPQQLADGADPYAKHLYWGYFVGEFDKEGDMVDESDPFLYWYLPILYVPRDYPDHQLPLIWAPTVNSNVGKPKDWMLLDFIEMHAAGMVLPKAKPAERKEDR